LKTILICHLLSYLTDTNLAVRTAPQDNLALIKAVPDWEHHLPVTFKEMVEEDMQVDEEEQTSSEGLSDKNGAQDRVEGMNDGQMDSSAHMEDGRNTIEMKGSDGAQNAQIRGGNESGDAHMHDGEGESNGSQASNEEEDDESGGAGDKDLPMLEPTEKQGSKEQSQKQKVITIGVIDEGEEEEEEDSDDSGGAGDEDHAMLEPTEKQGSKGQFQKQKVITIGAIDEGEEEEEEDSDESGGAGDEDHAMLEPTEKQGSKGQFQSTNSSIPPVNDAEEDVQMQGTQQHPLSSKSSRKIEKYKHPGYWEEKFEMPTKVTQNIDVEKHKVSLSSGYIMSIYNSSSRQCLWKSPFNKQKFKEISHLC
jgi:hypothetical protein